MEDKIIYHDNYFMKSAGKKLFADFCLYGKIFIYSRKKKERI